MAEVGDPSSEAIESNIVEYLMQLSQVENDEMCQLSGLTMIQEFLKADCSSGKIKLAFLQNGLTDALINAFDTGMSDRCDLAFLDVALKCLFYLSKLPISPVQPLISENVIKRLLMVMDLRENVFQFSYKMKKICEEMCVGKHLVGKVQAVKMNSDKWNSLHKMSKDALLSQKKLPESVNFCSLIDCDDEEQVVDLSTHLIKKDLAWPDVEDLDNNQEDEEVQDETWEDIVVTKFVNGPVFWARIGLKSIQNAHDIQSLLKTYHQDGKLKVCQCNKNDYVVVSKRTDGQGVSLYRAQVMSVDHMTAKVWMLDYGRDMTVDSSNVFCLPDEVSLDLYPPQISLCCLKGVKEPPLLLDAVETSVAVLCNLCCKSFPAGEMMTKLGGLDIIVTLLKCSVEPDLNIQLLRLVSNLTHNPWMTSHLSETNFVQIVLDKIENCCKEGCEKMKNYLRTCLVCLSNLLYKNDTNRAAFYHSNGISIILQCITNSKRGDPTYNLATKCLKNFLRKIAGNLKDGAETKFSSCSKPSKVIASPKSKKSPRPSEFSKIVKSPDDLKNLKGSPEPVEKALDRQRLHFDIDSESDEEHLHMNSQGLVADSHGKPTPQQADLSTRASMQMMGIEISSQDKQFLPEKYYILDNQVDFEKDSTHELRPNKTMSKVSASVIAECVCGMLNNGKGGTVYFGISADGLIHGILLTRDERDEFRLGVDRLMMDKLSPSLLHSMYYVDYTPVVAENPRTCEMKVVPDLYVTEIHVKPTKGVIYTLASTDQCFYRFGSTTPSLSIRELRQLIIMMEEDDFREEISKLQSEIQQLTGMPSNLSVRKKRGEN